MIQFLRGTSSQLQSSDQIFAAGQPIFESDSGQLKIGNGFSTFANLPYVGQLGTASSVGPAYYVGDNTSWWNHDEFYIDLNDSIRYSARTFNSIDLSGTRYILGDTYEYMVTSLQTYFTSLKSNYIGLWGQITMAPDSTWMSGLYISNLGVCANFKSDYFTSDQIADKRFSFIIHVLSCDTLTSAN